MIDVSDVVTDPDFCQDFQIERVTGSFANEGEYTRGTPSLLNRTGVIQPGASEEELLVLSEGERKKAVIRFWCAEEIRMSDADGANSDVIRWRGQWWRVAFAQPWADHGYYYGIAVRYAHD